MQTNPQTNTTRTHTPSKKNHLPYIELITGAADFISEKERIPRTIAEPIADFIIYVSFLHTKTDWWIDTFTKARTFAAVHYRNPHDYWRLIARRLSTPKVESECYKILPGLRRLEYFKHLHNKTAAPISSSPTLPKQYQPPQTYWPERKTPAPVGIPRGIKTLAASPRIRRGLKWKLDDRWDELSHIDKKIHLEGCRRAQNPKRKNDFPWAELGVESLSKKVRAPLRAVKRSRFHLCKLGLWCRIKRGYKDQGSSKYYVFITPKMAAAFFANLDRKRKRQQV
jgi:hypothetical protein